MPNPHRQLQKLKRNLPQQRKRRQLKRNLPQHRKCRQTKQNLRNRRNRRNRRSLRCAWGVTGEYLTEVTPYAAYTVAGGVTLTLQPQRLVDGTWTDVPVSDLMLTYKGSNSHNNTKGTFSASAPGQITITATGFEQTATVTVTSTYVPVSELTILTPGEYFIHERSASTGSFQNIKLNGDVLTLSVEPANASYPKKLTYASADETTAKFTSSGVSPKKAGTVTLSVTTNDAGLTTPVAAQSEITLQYLNPVTSVALPEDQQTFTVAENQTIDLPLQFTGSKSAEGYHVTEPGMTWTYSGDGVVEINRGTATISPKTELESCVANDQYQLTGIAPGTVTVTGTPVDTTGSAKPITFTVTVGEGAAVDSPALAAEAKTKALASVKAADGNKAYKFGLEWSVFTLTRSGVTVNMTEYLPSVKTTYQNPKASNLKPTTLARVILTLGVLGEDASDFAGIDLIDMLCRSESITSGGNEPMWALIALDSRDYAVPVDAPWTRSNLVNELITKYQNPETGGFGLNDNVTSSVDMTAMAVQALAPYVDANAAAKAAVDKALVYLQNELPENCRYDSSESVAQVILALTMLDKDPVDPEGGFVKSPARNLITGLLSYQQEDGAFLHQYTDEYTNKTSALQAIYAIEAYQRYLNGENTLYDFSDVDLRTTLAAKIKEAAALKEADYTAASWTTLQRALTAAQEVYDNNIADNAAVQRAAANLSAAILALQPAASSGGGDKPQTGDKTITVSFRLVGDSKHDDAASHEKYVNWIKTFNVTVAADSTVYDVFAAALAEKGMDFEEGQDSYISAIQAPAALGGYWLAEFDNGPSSGWKYMVNGKYSDVGLRYYWPKNGDKIIWRYVDDYTDAVDNTTKWQEAADVTPTGGGSGSGAAATEGTDVTCEMKPEVTVGAGGEAIAKPADKVFTDTVAQAKQDKADTIVIEPDVKGDATKVGVELAKAAVAKMTEETDAALTLKTDLGTVTVPARGLEQLANAKGSSVTVAVETKDGAANIEVAVGGKAVENVSGGIGVTLPAARADAGNVLVIVKADGTQEIVKKSIANGKNVQAVVGGSCTVKVIANGKAFADTAGHWGKDAVTFVTAHELFNGTSDKSFEPDAAMSRAMLATVLWRLEDEQTVTAANTFADIADGQYYTAAVAWASDRQIVTGYEQGTFAPNRNINREELAAMLYRYAKTAGLNGNTDGDLSKFSDGGNVSAYAADAMQWAVGAGLMNGKENNALDPQGNATRAEVAATVQRLVTLMVQ